MDVRKEYPDEPVAYFLASKVRDRFQYFWYYSAYEGKRHGTPSRPKGDFLVELEVKETTWAQRRKDKNSLFVPSRWERAAEHIVKERGKRSSRSWVKEFQSRGASPEEWRIRAMQRRKMRRQRLFEARTGVKGDGGRVLGWQPQSEAVVEEKWEAAAAEVKSLSEAMHTEILEERGLLAFFCRKLRAYSVYSGS
ncbi:hypothetical protein LTR85_002323 [Meristemomyces frigidus]|nr:hypothetical protein LTR85_002323 [Meristemomyces frigidus]